jgi:DICT domain-containing protein
MRSEHRPEGIVTDPGVSVANLRSWEQRYGLPRPQRSPTGQRRYRESDCALLAAVLKRRRGGQSLGAAFGQAGTDAVGPEESVFAGLRLRHPQLTVHVINKKFLCALTWAIEDDCCARAQRPVLIGYFQRQRFYKAAKARWQDLAGTAEQTIVFADFTRTSRQSGPITEIALDQRSPARREWVIVCDAPDQPACVAGSERPGHDQHADGERIFEVVWSVDPSVVRDALRIAVAMAAPAMPGLVHQLDSRLNDSTSRASADLTRATGLIERTLDYLAESSSR